MFLTPDTTAILVADRRRARMATATRRRSLRTALRQALAPRPPAPTRLPAPTGRTRVGSAPRAA